MDMRSLVDQIMALEVEPIRADSQYCGLTTNITPGIGEVSTTRVALSAHRGGGWEHTASMARHLLLSPKHGTSSLGASPSPNPSPPPILNLATHPTHEEAQIAAVCGGTARDGALPLPTEPRDEAERAEVAC
jgi:hypothetical protein